MAMVVKNNLMAVRTLNQLNQNNSELNKRLAKVSSGMKITSAGDDASGYSISERMREQIRSLNQDVQNVQNGSAMIKIALGGVEDIINVLRAMKEKAINAANDSNSEDDRRTIQKELTQMTATINDMALDARYNGKRLIDGSYDPKIKYADASTSALQVAKAMMSSLNETTLSGTAALDAAINSASNGKFATTDALVNKFMSDLESSSSYTDFLETYCGIILGNEDTGAITGSDAGGDTVKTAKSIVPEQVDVSSWGIPTAGSSTTIDGLTIKWPTEGATTGTLTNAEKHILAGLNSDWIKQSLNLVKESYGIDFNSDGATVKDINVEFYDSDKFTDKYHPANALAFVKNLSPGGKATQLDLVINMKYYNDIKTNSEDGESSKTSVYLDRTLAHEFTHAVMAANINNFNDLPLYLIEGTAELVHGIDDVRPDIMNALLGTRKSDLEKILNGELDGTTGKEYTNAQDPYAAGYMLLRYLGKQGQSPTGTKYVESMRYAPLVIQDGTQAGQHNNFYIKDMQTKSLTAGEIFNSDGELINENDKARYEALNNDADKQAAWLETLNAAKNMTIDDISLLTVKDANIAIRVIDGALEYALDNATTIGAYLQRLESTETNLVTSHENVTASESTIRDADMAKEMTAYTKANVLSQAAQSMLAQANQSATNVLSLLR